MCFAEYKPKLRPVSVRRVRFTRHRFQMHNLILFLPYPSLLLQPSHVEDDYDLSYDQLFERVFVVGLKQDPTSKKLVTEVTYTFPPRPIAEVSSNTYSHYCSGNISTNNIMSLYYRLVEMRQWNQFHSFVSQIFTL